MKLFTLSLALSLVCTIAFGQKKEEADKLVNEGIAYHDKGDYEGAITRYNKALELDKDNLLALAEKAFSLLSQEKYDESISNCQKAIAAHPGEDDLKTVYVTYGNACDALKNTDKSIEVYNEGIKQFPNYYQLHFNKGVSLASVKKTDEALKSFQSAAIANPKHGSSHNAIGRLSNAKDKRIPAILAFCRFLVIEPQSKRAKENLSALQELMKGNVEETGKKSITISVSSDMLGDTTANGKPKEDSFGTVDFALSMATALDYEKKNKKKSDVENFARKMETICSLLKETKKDNYGFFWDYYAPYFIEMNDKKLVETFSYIAFVSSDDEDVAKWVKKHGTEIDTFFAWSAKFNWKQN